eukprot:3171117-Prymnesium_polylepis.1
MAAMRAYAPALMAQQISSISRKHEPSDHQRQRDELAKQRDRARYGVRASDPPGTPWRRGDVLGVVYLAAKALYNSEISQYLSAQERRTYQKLASIANVSSLRLLILCIIFGGVIVVLATALLVFLVEREWTKMAGKNRLCYTKTSRYVELDTPKEEDFAGLPGVEPSLCYHLFLS